MRGLLSSKRVDCVSFCRQTIVQNPEQMRASIAHYKIISKIGSGGMGAVYLAEDTKLDRQVALKILLDDLAKDADRVRRFVQEAKAASALNHPNILTIHEIGESEGQHYIATELIKGETLRDRLRKAPLSLRDTIDISLQTASALNAAHEAGIVHRDIKPENIMIRDDGGVKVLDFGLVKLSEKKNEADSSDPTRVKTSPGTVMGTATYMSPEQARGKETDNRTDIWSMGVVLYEMLSGKTPFAGESTNDTIAAILKSEPEPIDGAVPQELRRMIRRTLQKRADERYQTVKDMLLDIRDLKRDLEFSEELERSHIPNQSRSSNVSTGQLGEHRTLFHTGSPSTQTSLASQPSSAEYLVSEVRKHKFATLAVLVALFLATVGAGYWYLNRSAANTVNSIAVLPFANVGGDPEFEFAVDGLAEALINNLSRLPNMKVIARSSSFTFKDKKVDPIEAATKLGVQAIVTGRVQQRGDNVSIAVEMVNATDRTQMWGETYNRKASEMQNLQTEIARTISEKLRNRLTGEQEKQLAKGETTNPQAYEQLLKGAYFARRGGRSNTGRAVEHFEQAVAIDPLFANAYAGLSIVYSNMSAFGSSGDRKNALQKQRTAALKALEIAPDSDQVLNALAISKTFEYKWNEAETAYKRAIEINPNYIAAYSNLANLYISLKRFDEGMALSRHAIELDPLRANVRANHMNRAVWAGRFDEAIEAAPEAISLAPENPITYVNRGAAYERKRMFPDAIADLQKACEIDKENLDHRIELARILAISSDRAGAEAILKEIEPHIDKTSQTTLAGLYAALADNQKALDLLEKAYAEGVPGLRSLAADYVFDPLRTEPRFKELLRKLNLPE
jgi:serine/threonine protein kinase/tetratricopeptide (TPR) repeat protein